MTTANMMRAAIEVAALVVSHQMEVVVFSRCKSSSHESASSCMERKRRFAPWSRRAESGRGPVLTAMVKHPAATPACTPSGAFSMMIVLDWVIGAMVSQVARKYAFAFSIPMR